MARGFESKDVEYQQAERERQHDRRADITPQPRGAESRRLAIELSLTRMRADLGKACAAAHRQMIEGAIATLEAELASLSDRP
jgi:hypothetical protein